MIWKPVSIEEGIIQGDLKGKEIYLKAIKSAKKELILGAFKLHQGQSPDSEILKAIKAAVEQGASVSVLLESRLSDVEQRNFENLPIGASLKRYQETGAKLISDIKIFNNIHLKVVVSPELVIIGTTNYDDPTINQIKRDFCVILKEAKIVEELNIALKQAISGNSIQAASYKVVDIKPNETRLTWGSQILSHILEMINGAQKEIIIYQQDIQDTRVKDALADALQRGIKVTIIMSEFPFGKKHPNKNLNNLQYLAKFGAQIYLTGEKPNENELPLHIHAKILLVDPDTDKEMMLLGSFNFYGPELDPESKNLNLGIITRNKNSYIKPVYLQARKDINNQQLYRKFLEF